MYGFSLFVFIQHRIFQNCLPVFINRLLKFYTHALYFVRMSAFQKLLSGIALIR